MRKLGSVILNILYAAFAIGIWIHQHHCCCKSHVELNGVELQEKSCCKGKECHDSDCENGDGLYLSIDDAHQSPGFQLEAFLLSQYELYKSRPFVFLEKQIDINYQEPHDINGPPLYIRYGTSLVYG